MEQQIRQLLVPGSSLGGARPKASFVDERGELWLARFPSSEDRATGLGAGLSDPDLISAVIDPER